MSSAPPPLPTLLASAPPPTLTPPVLAPDYGPLGTAPSGAGVQLFPQKASNKAMPTIVLVLGVLAMLIGLLMLVKGAGGSAVPLIVGVLFLLFGWFLRKNQVNTDVVCDPHGLTVRKASRKEGPLPSERIAWSAITALRCWQTVTRGGESTGGDKYEQWFGIETAAGLAFQVSEYAIKGLPNLIELTGLRTPQLPYRWIPKKNAKGLPTLEQSGHLVKVPR